jgi:hypothetical protein
MIKRSLAVLALIAVPAFADPPKAPKLQGTFGFDVMKSETTKCAKVTGALLAKLTRDYRCTVPEEPGRSASGLPVVASCEVKKGHSSYLLFASQHDCEEERLTQVANGS